ncbi:nucleolar protein 12 [Chamberlinius hualienensis]
MAAPTTKGGGRKRPKNKRTKVQVVFSEDKRKDYLCGFKKRKDERKRKGREQLELKLKEEKKQIKQERKEVLLNMFQQQKTIPEVQNLVKPVTYELEEHTVTVTSINDVDFQGQNDLLLGQNKDSDEDEEGPDTNASSITLNPSSLKEMKKTESKKITSTKTFKMKEKLRQKTAQKKEKRRFKPKKILRKRDKRKSKHVQNT